MAAYPEQVYQCQSCLFKTSSITIIGDHVENCTGTATIAHDAAQEESLDAVQDFLTRHQDDETLTILAQDGHDAGDSQSVHAWPAAATLLLIDSFRKHQDDFNHPNKKKNAIWKDVAKEMQGEGYAVDAAQCDNKMRSLKKRYKLIKDKASKTGQGAMRPWQFFNAMDDLLSGDPTIRPIALKSSLPFASTSTAATPSCVGGQGSSTSGLQPTKISVGVPSPTGIQSPALHLFL
ncbi:trihelix transcription factor ASIL2-like [Portunus trituberculatus]|uniref:trihelix transcription factor ASIL2-like n=1 Tax=Portunus trituberculatus TaxID=210409 RepID=UPI001E1CE01D|nr:trihelix transcription factor ASIL2-like [Portunus trituberculatus]